MSPTWTFVRQRHLSDSSNFGVGKMSLSDECRPISPELGKRGKVANFGRNACLLHFLEDSDCGVSFDQFAVATCKSHSSKYLEQTD